MAGTLLTLIPKRLFDFSGVQPGAQSVTVIDRIDVSQYIDCQIALRVHDLAIGTSDTIKFDVYGDGYTEDDPGARFRTSAPLFVASAISGLMGGTSTFLTYGGTLHGHYISLVVNLNRVSSLPSSCWGFISLDIVLRTTEEKMLPATYDQDIIGPSDDDV